MIYIWYLYISLKINDFIKRNLVVLYKKKKNNTHIVYIFIKRQLRYTLDGLRYRIIRLNYTYLCTKNFVKKKKNGINTWKSRVNYSFNAYCYTDLREKQKNRKTNSPKHLSTFFFFYIHNNVLYAFTSAFNICLFCLKYG